MGGEVARGLDVREDAEVDGLAVRAGGDRPLELCSLFEAHPVAELVGEHHRLGCRDVVRGDALLDERRPSGHMVVPADGSVKDVEVLDLLLEGHDLAARAETDLADDLYLAPGQERPVGHGDAGVILLDRDAAPDGDGRFPMDADPGCRLLLGRLTEVVEADIVAKDRAEQLRGGRPTVHGFMEYDVVVGRLDARPRRHPQRVDRAAVLESDTRDVSAAVERDHFESVILQLDSRPAFVGDLRTRKAAHPIPPLSIDGLKN